MLLKLGLPTGPPGLPNGDGVKETCKKSSFIQIISTNVKNLSPAAMATVRTKRRRKTTKQQGNKTTKKAKKASLNQILNSLVSQVILIWLVCDAISPHVVIICVMLNRPTVDLTNDSCYNLRSLCTPATETLTPIGMRWTGICSDFYSEYKGMRAWAF